MATDNAHSESKRLGKEKKMKAPDSYSLNNFGAKGSQNEDTKAIPSFLSLRESSSKWLFSAGSKRPKEARTN
jgi:hypothetical protein